MKNFIEKLKEDLIRDEGKKLDVYHDHLGYKTVGIGHLILKDDKEFDLPIGAKITEERVDELFKRDIGVTLIECKKLYSDFDGLPEEIQLVIANMMFNLGYPRLSKFKNMKRAVDNRDWTQTAIEMKDSKWYRQVTNRAKRLISRVESVAYMCDDGCCS
ncbi:MAG: hypothetical protein CBE47_00880 [Pelagibacteraceae bacterium TMED287]|nr:MAG: hypothetical protein CBE47_00880 [Pelagibacteraceae bacterium TMED287]|tara:strand:+ start:432 stop:908 length:477 start_codon:yes stop_codon:yes gene_type:complete